MGSHLGMHKDPSLWVVYTMGVSKSPNLNLDILLRMK